jgi:2-amino-4,5-dihydroxy-6-oxo-7-(phosphooxy)heptanoate synthase
MTATGRALRLARLLKGGDAPLLFVPLDHTVTDGPFTDAQRYTTLIETFADSGVDAIVVHKGRVGTLPQWVYARLSVVVHISASTKYAEDPSYKYQVGDAEDCLRRGADAVSVHVNLGSLTEDRQIRMMADVADSCDRVGLPLLAMLYPRGPGIKGHPPLQTLLHAASLAVDLGADIVKLPLSGSVQEMTQIIESCSIPVLAAGGAQISDTEFGTFVGSAVRSGARGLAAGRNIFLAADPAKKVREVREILAANYPSNLQAPTIAIAQATREYAQSANG